jgi:hypothetical protein
MFWGAAHFPAGTSFTARAKKLAYYIGADLPPRSRTPGDRLVFEDEVCPAAGRRSIRERHDSRGRRWKCGEPEHGAALNEAQLRW